VKGMTGRKESRKHAPDGTLQSLIYHRLAGAAYHICECADDTKCGVDFCLEATSFQGLTAPSCLREPNLARSDFCFYLGSDARTGFPLNLPTAGQRAA
jgi:hypothetical protein